MVRGGWRLTALRAVAAAGVVAAIAWHFAAAGRPASEPGRPVLRVVQAGGPVPVLVVPNRPGWNLVHVGLDGIAGGGAAPAGGSPGGPAGGSAGGSIGGSIGVSVGVSVGTERGRLVAAQRRPGASGGWIAVHLPAGRARLWVERGGHTAELAVDTGEPAGGAGPPDLTGPDGPECASAVLGRLVAGAAGPVASCPAGELLATDASALRGIVRFLAGRGQPAITVVADSSPRSVAAAAVLRSESERAGIVAVTATDPPAASPPGPIVVVAGWATADGALRVLAADPVKAARGAYLAPWLLHAPVLAGPVARVVASSYSPAEEPAMEYLAAVADAFPGEPASASGFAGWLAARGAAASGPVRLYAAARVTLPGVAAGHGHPAAGWLPGGRLTAVSTPLDVSASGGR